MVNGRARPGNRFWLTITALVTALSLVAAGACGGDDSGEGASDGTADGSSADVDRDASLVFAIQYGFNSLDPHRTPSSQADALWMRPLYDQLISIGKDGDGNAALEPQLARSFDVAEDGMAITLRLRDDVTFADGTPLDGEVVEANLQRAMGAGSTVASLLASIEAVEVVDPTQVILHLSRPDPALLWNLAVTTVGMMINPAAFDTNLTAQPAGSGPFTLVSAAKDADVVYERRDGYWDPDAALVQKLTLSTILDGNVRYNGTQSGEYHAAFLVPPADAQARDLEDDGFQWIQELGPISNGLLLNTNLPPFDDVRVRRAAAMAIDKDGISSQLTGDIAPVVFEPFNPGLLGHDPDLEPLSNDLDAARALVEEAGAVGAEVRLIQQTPQEPQTSMALVVQEALDDIGLQVELLPLSPTEARPAFRDGGEHGLVGPLLNGFDPAQTLADSYLGGGDMPGTAPAELVAMADAALRLPFDSAERETAYQEISAYLVDNPIHTPIIQFSSVILARPEVVGADQLMAFQIGTLDFRGVGLTGS